MKNSLSFVALATLSLSANSLLADSDATLRDRLTHCASIAQSDSRLSCFDKITSNLAHEPRTASQQGMAVERDNEDDFGLQKTTDEDIESITLRIDGVRNNGLGQLILQMDNGQVWEETENARFHLKKGQTVTVKRGVLGSFFLLPESGKWQVRVRRIK